MAGPLLPDALRVHPQDDVLVALRDLQAGEIVRFPGAEIIARAPIPRGHKIAVTAIAAGTLVRKYGWPIGRATRDIAQGEHVHTHNLATTLTGHTDYTHAPPMAAPDSGPTARRIADVAGERLRGKVDGVYALTQPLGCSQLGDDLAHTRRLLAPPPHAPTCAERNGERELAIWKTGVTL